MQAIVYEDAPWAFVASWKQNAVSTANVENFALEPSFLLVLRHVSKG
jgi:peptide/nickel transport system substrate-binding protein